MSESRFIVRAERTAVVDAVYDRLLGMLMDGDLEPGERIRVDAVSRQLGVSQTPVRESLSRLEAEGLVTKEHLIGYSTASKLTPSQFEDLFEARLLLEPHCASLASARHQREQVDQLALLAADMRKGYEAGELSYGAFAKRDAEFHRAIVTSAGNTYFPEILDKLHAHLQLFRLLRDSHVVQDALDEHEQIVVALRQRDEDTSRSAMRAHLVASRTRLRTAFQYGSDRSIEKAESDDDAADAAGDLRKERTTASLESTDAELGETS